MEMRLATMEDADGISRLAYPLAAKHIAVDFDDQGRQRLLASLEPRAIGLSLAGGMRYHVAVEDGVVHGVIGMRDDSHVYHLFVAESLQRQGLATRLWQVARQACVAAGNTGAYTVNSSRQAIPFYCSLGFVETGPAECRGGIVATPMRLDSADDEPAS